MELPKIISVDDHVVEPSHVWQTWLPAKHRERGPKVVRKRWGDFVHKPGARYEMHEDPDGLWGDAWYYDDELIYVHKRFVAIPQSATSQDGETVLFDRTQMVMTAITYDEMRAGCYDRDARIADMELNWVDGSLPFPTFPRFCGQTFHENDDRELGLACVRAYNDWMVEEWCGPSGGMNIPLCLIPLWDPELAAAETRRNAERGVRAICFSELPTRLSLPSIHTDYWSPLFDVCNDMGVTLCMHIGSSSSNPAASPDVPGGVGGTLAFNNSMASLADWLFSGKLIRFPKLKLAYSEGQIGWIPYALERADTVWEHHDSWQHSKELIPEPPSTYYYGRIYGCFTADRHGLRSLDEVGPDNICFETDYPHTDTTWPDSKAYAEKILAGLDDEVVYKVVRGNAIRMLELDRVLSTTVQEHTYFFDIDATPEEVWRVPHPRPKPRPLGERRVIEHGDVRIEIVHEGDDNGQGLVRTCTFRVPRLLLSGGVGRSWECVIEVRPNEYSRYEAVGKPLWSEASGWHRLEVLDDGRTRVHFGETYHAFNPVVRVLLERYVHRFISKDNDRVVREAVEQGVAARRARRLGSFRLMLRKHYVLPKHQTSGFVTRDRPVRPAGPATRLKCTIRGPGTSSV